MAFAEFTFRSPCLSPRIHLPFSLPFPFIVALAAGAGLRLVAMLGYPGALWFAGDSYVYLGAALRPQPNLSKTTGYSVFLHALEPFHSLTLVAGLQHLMGLAVAVMIYLLLRRNGVSQRWATAATLPVLLDGFVIEDEHMVMAEALFTFLVMLSMLLILWRPSRRSGGRSRCWRACWPGTPSTCAAKACRCCSCSRSLLLVRGLRRGRRLALAELARLAGGRRDGRRLRGRRSAAYAAWFHSWWGSYTLSRADGVLPVGPGVLVRRVLRDQAAGQRAGDLPVRAAVQPDAAR